jgi:hypothetical protein
MNGMFNIQETWKQTEGLPESERGKAFQTLLNRQLGDSDIKELGVLLDKFGDPERMRQQLQIASEFDKERMKEAGKYKALFDLPGIITSAVATPGIIAAQGAGNIANIMTQGAQNIPALTRFDRGSYSFTPTRYFG